MSAEQQHRWLETNRRHLVAELARLKQRLSASSEAPAASSERESAAGGAAIDELTTLFALSAFERDILLLAAGVEMDAQLAELCAARHGRPYATFGLALAALADPDWSALAPVGSLRRFRLVEIDDSAGIASGRLRIDERILHYLAGVNYLDPRLRPLVSARPVPAVTAESHRQVSETLVATLTEDRAQRGEHGPIWLLGDDAGGQVDVAAESAHRLGLGLYVALAEDLPANPAELEAFAVLWQREAALLRGALFVECRDGDAPKSVVRLAEQTHGLLFLGSREALPTQRPGHRFAITKPDAKEQKRLWEAALGPAAIRLNGALDAVSSQFRLSAQSIVSTGMGLRSAVARSDEPDALLWDACRAASRSRLEDLAQRLEPAARMRDLILPEAQNALLVLIAGHVNHQLRVYEEWGFARQSSRSLGLTALFAGESGTGKTMAAEALARELHLDLYRIDLSAVVSKYIGETEKNLRRVFDAAEDSGAILLFDEADALFGKRSEVKDSHDRYANIEVSYLLQRMEAYRGLAILTTNMKGALDPAFQRRLRFIVPFPFPDAAQREAIWRGIFPPETPTDRIDYAKLARVNVSGGVIRNIALAAAFLAARAEAPVGMSHLLAAARSEGIKRDRPLADAETRGWA